VVVAPSVGLPGSEVTTAAPAGRWRRWVVPPAAVLALLVPIAVIVRHHAQSPSTATLLNRALTAHYAGKLDDAKRDYTRVLRKDARNRFALFDLGVIAQAQNDTADADRLYRTALAVDPNFQQALFNLAILRVAMGAPAEAEQLYRRLLAVNPMYAAAHLNLGFLLRQLGRESEAGAELATAAQLDPKLAQERAPTAAGP